MKRVILFICLAVWVLPLAAQIDFRESGFAKALEAAKVENKLVFMDCYTSWCGPCKRMAAQEFTQEKAGEYFNPRFVSVKIDMEKGEGVELRKRYDVNAYPTLLVLNAEGELLCRHAGYLSVDKLIDFAENGVKGGGLTDMHKRYAAGERSVEFIRGYLAQLEEAAMSGTMYTVANDYLQDKTDAVFTDAAIYAIFRDYAIPVNPVRPQGGTGRTLWRGSCPGVRQALGSIRKPLSETGRQEDCRLRCRRPGSLLYPYERMRRTRSGSTPCYRSVGWSEWCSGVAGIVRSDGRI